MPTHPEGLNIVILTKEAWHYRDHFKITQLITLPLLHLVGNTSVTGTDVTLNVYLKYYAECWLTTDSTVSNGVSETYTQQRSTIARQTTI